MFCLISNACLETHAESAAQVKDPLADITVNCVVTIVKWELPVYCVSLVIHKATVLKNLILCVMMHQVESLQKYSFSSCLVS